MVEVTCMMELRLVTRWSSFAGFDVSSCGTFCSLKCSSLTVWMSSLVFLSNVVVHCLAVVFFVCVRLDIFVILVLRQLERFPRLLSWDGFVPQATNCQVGGVFTCSHLPLNVANVNNWSVYSFLNNVTLRYSIQSWARVLSFSEFVWFDCDPGWFGEHFFVCVFWLTPSWYLKVSFLC